MNKIKKGSSVVRKAGNKEIIFVVEKIISEKRKKIARLKGLCIRIIEKVPHRPRTGTCRAQDRQGGGTGRQGRRQSRQKDLSGTRKDVARYPPIKRIPFFRESFFRRCASAAGAIYADADADAAPLPAAVVSSAF